MLFNTLLRAGLQRTVCEAPLRIGIRNHAKQRFNRIDGNLQASYVNDTTAKSNKTSLTARLRQLSKKYGYTAVAVYFGLSAIDFPLCYLLVRWIGAEKIAQWENDTANTARRLKQRVLHGMFTDREDKDSATPSLVIVSDPPSVEHLVTPSIWTQLAVAYILHKSLIFLRVPLTAAFTPRVARLFTAWKGKVS